VGRIKFVAMLWLMALLGWLMGGGALFQKVRFQMDEQTGVMKSTDPGVARALKYNPKDRLPADVVFETSQGNVSVSKLLVRPQDFEALVNGSGVPVRFRKGDPHEVLYPYEEMSWGFAWLAIGLAGTMLAIVAHRKLRQESD
jgi:hypothetical protein